MIGNYLGGQAAVKRYSLILGATLVSLSLGLGGARAQEVVPPAVAFKSSVDVVRVAAVVRDHKGRFVQDLKARDFEVLDAGEARAIADFQRDAAGVSIAVLFDVSGSMEGRLPQAREAASHVLSWMDARDEVAIYTF